MGHKHIGQSYMPFRKIKKKGVIHTQSKQENVHRFLPLAPWQSLKRTDAGNKAVVNSGFVYLERLAQWFGLNT